MEGESGRRPLHMALTHDASQSLEAARGLLPASGLGAGKLLATLHGCAFDAQPLYAELAAHFALGNAEWERVPAPCCSMGHALPAVLERS